MPTRSVAIESAATRACGIGDSLGAPERVGCSDLHARRREDLLRLSAFNPAATSIQHVGILPSVRAALRARTTFLHATPRHDAQRGAPKAAPRQMGRLY